MVNQLVELTNEPIGYRNSLSVSIFTSEMGSGVMPEIISLDKQPTASTDDISVSESLRSDLDSIIARWNSDNLFEPAEINNDLSFCMLILETDPPVQTSETSSDTAIARGLAGDLDWSYAMVSGSSLVSRSYNSTTENLDDTLLELTNQEPVVVHFGHIDPALYYQPEEIMRKIIDTAGGEKFNLNKSGAGIIFVVSTANAERIPDIESGSYKLPEPHKIQ